MSHVLAVDVGGSKLAVALVDGTGRVVRAQRAPTPQGPRASAEPIWDALDDLVTALVADGADGDREITGVGIGCGGPMA
ncbi:MAG TPA: ROK family protein, partial [Actinomycetes bacterium]